MSAQCNRGSFAGRVAWQTAATALAKLAEHADDCAFVTALLSEPLAGTPLRSLHPPPRVREPRAGDRMIVVLRAGPLTVKEAAFALDVSYSRAQKVLSGLRAEGRVRMAGGGKWTACEAVDVARLP